MPINYKNIFRNFIKFQQIQAPQFSQLSRRAQLPNRIAGALHNKLFLTPRYQLVQFTEEYNKYIQYLQRKKNVTTENMKQFVENTILEYEHMMKFLRPEYQLRLQKDFYIPSTDACEYHGKVDWVISAKGFHHVPILFCPEEINIYAGGAMALSNMYLRQSKNQQKLKHFPKPYQSPIKHMNSYGQNTIEGFSIVTTGHEWQMFKVNSLFDADKSLAIQSEDPNRIVFFEEQKIKGMMGMLDYCINLPKPNVNVLEKAFQYIDEQRTMELLDKPASEKDLAPLTRVILRRYQKKM